MMKLSSRHFLMLIVRRGRHPFDTCYRSKPSQKRRTVNVTVSTSVARENKHKISDSPLVFGAAFEGGSFRNCFKNLRVHPGNSLHVVQERQCNLVLVPIITWFARTPVTGLVAQCVTALDARPNG